MDDWRLNGQEEYLADEVLYKVTFPDFWERAYRERHAFFRRIQDYGIAYVKETGKWQELLEGDSVQRFWHQHCAFCWEKAVTYEPATFYCTEDMGTWICEECFQDFREKFRWQVRPAEKLFEERE